MAASDRFILPLQQAFDNAGLVEPGAKLYFWVGGAGAYSVAKDTYSESTLVTPNANPVVADASGRFGAIFLSTGSYGVQLKDADGVLLYAQDPVAASTVAAATTTVSGTVELATTAEGLTGSSATLVPPVAVVTEMIQQGFMYGTGGGSANAITITPTRTPTALAAGMKAIFRATSSNSAATTLNYAGLGVVAVKVGGSTSGGTACNGGEIITGMTYEFTYSGTDTCWFVSTIGWTPATIMALTEDTAPAVGDWLLTYDISTTLPKKVSITTLASTQADQETSTDLTSFVTPGRQHYHPSACKVWVEFDNNGESGTTEGSFNVTSLTDGGVGISTVNFTTAFATVVYCVENHSNFPTSNPGWTYYNTPVANADKAVGSYKTTGNHNTSATIAASDRDYNFFNMWGDQ